MSTSVLFLCAACERIVLKKRATHFDAVAAIKAGIQRLRAIGMRHVLGLGGAYDRLAARRTDPGELNLKLAYGRLWTLCRKLATEGRCCGVKECACRTGRSSRTPRRLQGGVDGGGEGGRDSARESAGAKRRPPTGRALGRRHPAGAASPHTEASWANALGQCCRRDYLLCYSPQEGGVVWEAKGGFWLPTFVMGRNRMVESV